MLNPSTSVAATAWRDKTGELPTPDVSDIAVMNGSGKVIFAALSDEGIYRSRDDGATWTYIFGGVNQTGRIHELATHPADPDTIWAATDKGLYVSSHKWGSRWKQLTDANEAGTAVTSVALNHTQSIKRIYAGTPSGLMITEKGKPFWSRATGALGKSPIEDIAIHPSNQRTLFSASGGEVWRSLDRGESWDKVFSLGHSAGLEISELPGETFPEELQTHRINIIRFGKHDPDLIYAGTDEGLYMSRDLGSAWKHVPTPGLLSSKINSLVILPHSDARLIVGTNRGVYAGDVNRETWVEFYKGMTARKIRSLALDPSAQTAVWAATENGLFEYEIDRYSDRAILFNEIQFNGDAALSSPLGVLEAFRHEPSIHQVQKAAIEYAEVQPEKIERWRSSAQWAAWMPRLSIMTSMRRVIISA